MSYVHCHKCNWSQDDFWSETYNPLRLLVKEEERNLLSENLDGKVPWDSQTTWREYFALILERARAKIQGMRYSTREDAKNAGWKCPVCQGKLCED